MRIAFLRRSPRLLIVGLSGPLRAQAPQGKNVTVADVWARATPKGSTTAVIYMTVINNGQDADQLLGATTPMAEKVQLHSNTNDKWQTKMRGAGLADRDR